MPSILYAPIYIAKQLNLSKEFAHIDLEYPDNPDGNNDPLINKLCIGLEHTNAIMAIVDPIRVAIADKNKFHSDPIIIKGLIKKMCYWAIGRYPLNYEEINGNCKIIVPPQGMTGYSVTLYDLIQSIPSGITPAEKKTLIKKLHSVPFPSLEARYYNNIFFSKRVSKNRISYVSTDPLDLIKRFDVNKIQQEAFYHKYPNFCGNAMMTSIITNRNVIDKPMDFKILQSLLRGIDEAIKMVYNSPQTAIKFLTAYNDDKFSVTKMGWHYRELDRFFEHIVLQEKIYSQLTDTFNYTQLENSIAIWGERCDFDDWDAYERSSLNNLNHSVQDVPII